MDEPLPDHTPQMLAQLLVLAALLCDPCQPSYTYSAVLVHLQPVKLVHSKVFTQRSGVVSTGPSTVLFEGESKVL